MKAGVFFLGCHVGSRLADRVIREVVQGMSASHRTVAVVSALDPAVTRGTLFDAAETLIHYGPEEMQGLTLDEVQELVSTLLPRYDALIAACPLAGAGELPTSWLTVADQSLLLVPASRSTVSQVRDWVTTWRDRGLPAPYLLVEQPGTAGDDLRPEEVASELGLELVGVVSPEILGTDPGLARRQDLRTRLQTALALDRAPAEEVDATPAGVALRAGIIPSDEVTDGKATDPSAETAGTEASTSIVEQVRLLEAMDRRRQETARERQLQAATVAETLGRLRAACRGEEPDGDLIRLARHLIETVTRLEALQHQETSLTAQIRQQAVSVQRWLERLVE